jgi:hypothetical protein
MSLREQSSPRPAGREQVLGGIARPAVLRCESISPRGTQCGLPEGHLGNHQNGMSERPWGFMDELVAGLPRRDWRAFDAGKDYHE